MLILPAWLIADARSRPLHQWGVRIAADCITDLAPHSVLFERYPADETWYAPDAVLAPGFVNTHTHTYGILAHGISLQSAPTGFWSFLKEFWWPLVEDRLDHAMIRAATELQCVRMLQSGVTSFYDCLEAPYSLPGALAVQANVVHRLGLRAMLSFEATERVSAANGQLGLQENASFIDACRARGGLVSGMQCIHTSFTCSTAFIKQAFALGRDLQTLVHLHCCEGTYESEYALAHFGCRPLHYYDSLGVAGPSLLASQCVQIDATEIDLIAQRGVRVSHMPLSNCEVGGGIAPIPELVQAGATVGLGSDGYIDDFFEVMRGAFLIHKANCRDPRVMPADLVWYLATEGGAKAIGLERVGRLQVGWQADLQLIRERLATPLAEHNLYEQLLLNCHASSVQATIVAGQVRQRDGNVPDVDMDSLVAQTQLAARRLWSRPDSVS